MAEQKKINRGKILVKGEKKKNEIAAKEET
jgi:hypothetical protein